MFHPRDLSIQDTRLRDALTSASPRISQRAMPALSLLIYAAVLALWLVLFARAFWLDNVLAWSAGIIYILYDSALMGLVAWLTWPLLGKGHAEMPIRDRSLAPTLGVIIAAYNEAKVLPETIAALYAQTDAPDQILIADDGSTDDTAEVMLRHFGLAAPSIGTISAPSPAHPAIRWLRLPQSGKATALNAALMRIDTAVVVTIDADTLAAPGSLAAIRQAFANEPNLVAGGGILIPVCSRTLMGQMLQWFQTYEYIRNIVARFAWARINALLLISGAFAAFRRDALVKVGGFDPECLVEDYELTHRLHRYSVDRNLGWKLRMIGSAHACTEAPSNVPAFLMQRRRWFAGFLQTQYWNRDMTGNRRFGRLGTIMLPVKALDTLQPIYGLTAFVLLLIVIGSGKLEIAISVFSIIGLKIVTDFIFQIWTIHLYRQLTGDRVRNSLRQAILAALVEPFSFQLLRHLGATWGWLSFLTRTQRWGMTERTAIGSAAEGHSSTGE